MVLFAVHGAMAGTFAARIPWIAERLDLSASALGAALTTAAVAASLVIPISGRVVHRFGGRAAVRVFVALWCLVNVLPVLAPSPLTFCAALIALGVVSGLSDVAMNGQGAEVERHLARPVMSSLHGAWSLGGLLASGLGILAARSDLDARLHFGAVALPLTAVTLVASRRLLDTRREAAAPPRLAVPPRDTWMLCLVGFCATFCHGAAIYWSAVYLVNVTGGSAVAGSVAYAAQACAVTAARFLGDLVTHRLGAARTVRASGVIAATGACLVVAARTPLAATIGFALLGIGVAVVLPVTFATVGTRSRNPSHAIASVACVIYTSNLVAPAVIGGVADLASLSVSFLLVAALGATMAGGAGAYRAAGRRDRTAARDHGRAGRHGSGLADDE